MDSAANALATEMDQLQLEDEDGEMVLEIDVNASIINSALLADPDKSIYQTVFSCNEQESSNQLILALDVENSFKPIIKLCKHATIGVNMPIIIFLRLLQLGERLTDFFNGHSVPFQYSLGPHNDGQKQDQIRLGARYHLVLYVTDTNVKLVSLVYNAYRFRAEVIITDEMWRMIVRLSDLLKHLVNKYVNYEKLVFTMFNGICFKTFHGIELSESDPDKMMLVRNFLNDDMALSSNEALTDDSSFDAIRAYEEIKLKCVEKIVGEVSDAYGF
jgi:hypothetical protein